MKRILSGLFFITAFTLLPMANALAVTIAPLKIETVGDPGTTISGELLLINGEKETTLYSSFERFDAQGEDGIPLFSWATEGLATWITITPEVTLAPFEQLEVPYTIHIPTDAPPGGNFAAIFWNTSPPDALEPGQVGVKAKLGVLVLLSVSGDIDENITLLEYGIENDQHLFTTLPVNLWYRFQNTGDDRVKPTGLVSIKNFFSLRTAKFDANPTDGNVLPNSIRKLTTAWTDKDENEKDLVAPQGLNFFGMAMYEFKHFHLGRFTANLHLEYGTEGKVADGKVGFWVIPWQLLVLVIPALFIILILGIISMKRYNRWIIRRAHGTSHTS